MILKPMIFLTQFSTSALVHLSTLEIANYKTDSGKDLRRAENMKTKIPVSS